MIEVFKKLVRWVKQVLLGIINRLTAFMGLVFWVFESSLGLITAVFKALYFVLKLVVKFFDFIEDLIFVKLAGAISLVIRRLLKYIVDLVVLVVAFM